MGKPFSLLFKCLQHITDVSYPVNLTFWIRASRSLDITTFYPCSTSPVYTSVAPTMVAPPIYLPQTVAPAAPVLAQAPPLPYNTYQYPTVWNGGDVLSAGNAEWAQVMSDVSSVLNTTRHPALAVHIVGIS
jgi:hypothetical protein